MNCRLALVTGATAGIGEATARALAASNVSLIITGRRHRRLLQLANELGAAGASVTPLCFDLSDAEQVRRVVSSHRQMIDAVDVLVNNAGLAKGWGPLSTGCTAHWDQMIDTNIKGLLYMLHSVLPAMIRQNRGHVVNIGSISALKAYPDDAVYCATKHAVRALGETLELELQGTNVRVTTIEPGVVATEFASVRLEDPVQAREATRSCAMLTAEDVADAILWCLTRPAHVNVSEITIRPMSK